MPVLAVVVIGALAAGVTVWLGKRPKPESPSAAAGGPVGGVSPERARHASSLLSEDQHRAVYGRIATNRPMEAITEYRRFTGRSLRDSMADVQSLAAHPQVYTLPQEQDPVSTEPQPGHGAGSDAPARAQEPAGQERAAGDPRPETDHADRADVSGEDAGAPPSVSGTAADGVSANRDAARDEHAGQGGDTGDRPRSPGEADAEGDRPSSGSTEAAQTDTVGEDRLPELPADLMVPAEWSAEPAPEDRPFEVEVMRGDGTVHLSSRDLPPWLRDQLSAMMRDGNLETAAVQLSTHTELSVPEAFELLRRIQESRGQ